MTDVQNAPVGIVSIGEMGVGWARYLIAHGYDVFTCVNDRSPATQRRAQAAGIILLESYEEFVDRCDIIFSIVPPRNARETAEKIAVALVSEDNGTTQSLSPSFSPSSRRHTSTSPLIYLDMNAIAPSTARSIAEMMREKAGDKVQFIDGGIIGGPPELQPSTSKTTAEKPLETKNSKDQSQKETWSLPSIITSGPNQLQTNLANLLQINHLNPEIGTASGLKCCFASLAKGFTALALQSFSTANQLGCLDDLEQYLTKYNPSALARVKIGVPDCVTKASRWVEEMREIGRCFFEDGGWAVHGGFYGEVDGKKESREVEGYEEDTGRRSSGIGEVEIKAKDADENHKRTGVFDAIAEVFEVVATDPVLRLETWEDRKRGTTAEDVVRVLGEGSLRPRKRRRSV